MAMARVGRVGGEHTLLDIHLCNLSGNWNLFSRKKPSMNSARAEAFHFRFKDICDPPWKQHNVPF